MPSDFGQPITFGSDETRAAHERRCQAIRRTMTVRFVVAHLHSVRTAAGERLTAGAEVRHEHFHGATLAPSAIVDWLVARGIVLESLVYSEPEPPRAA